MFEPMTKNKSAQSKSAAEGVGRRLPRADVGGAQHDVDEHPTERADRACESDQRTRHAARPRRLLVSAPSGSNAECERTAKLFAVLRHTFTFDERAGGRVSGIARLTIGSL
jgi:hypothetical protein